MLKRFACLLTALLMLAGAASAEEAYQLEVSCMLNAEETAQYLNAVTGDDASLQPRIKALTTGLAKLLNKASFKVIAQENGMALKLTVQDEVLLDMLCESAAAEDRIALPSLLPGHALVSVTDAQTKAAVERLFDELLLTDWAGIAGAFMQEAAAWGAELPQSTEMGRFVGDAYESGTFCTTITLDDHDLSVLADRLLTALEGKLGEETLAMLDDMLREARGKAQAMAAGEGRYILRCVTDMQGGKSVVRGYSLTGLHQDEQQMTLSLGMTEEAIRLVWGFGMAQGNRYTEAVLSPLPNEKSRLVLSMYDDPMRLGFQAVRAAEEQCLCLRMDSTLYSSVTDDGVSWLADTLVEQPILGDVRLLCSSYGIFDGSGVEQHWTAQIEGNTEPCLTIQMQLEPAEPLTFDWSGLERVDVDAAGIEAFGADMAETLSLRLFRLIPPELLTFLIQ